MPPAPRPNGPGTSSGSGTNADSSTGAAQPGDASGSGAIGGDSASKRLTPAALKDCPSPEGSEDKVLSVEEGLVLSDALLQDLPQDQRRALSRTQRLCMALKRLLPLRVSQSEVSSTSSK